MGGSIVDLSSKRENGSEPVKDRAGERRTLESTLQGLVSGLLDIYGDRIVSIILYGSVARGTQSEESDVDIAVILKNGATRAMYDQMLDLVVDLELSCGKVLSVIRIDYDKFREWENVMPYYKNIKRDGVVLWKAA